MRARLLGLATLIGLALLTRPAAAAQLDTLGDGAIGEASLAYDVRLDGVVATVTARHTFTGTAAAAEAVYAFALPGDAILVGMAVTLPGRKPQRAGAVDGLAAITPGTDRAAAAVVPDLGLVWRLGEQTSDGTSPTSCGSTRWARATAPPSS